MSVLVFAPHADDEVLGAGGLISLYARAGKCVNLVVMTGHGEEPHPIWQRESWEIIRTECREAAKILGIASVAFYELPAACLDVVPAWKINQIIFDAIKKFEPEEIYTPYFHDLHQDHKAIAYGINVALRPYLPNNRKLRRVLAYETLTETHLYYPNIVPSFQPNVFIDISETLDMKLLAMEKYKSQLQSDFQPRSLNSIRSLALARGAQIGVKAAEAFVLLGEYIR